MIAPFDLLARGAEKIPGLSGSQWAEYRQDERDAAAIGQRIRAKQLLAPGLEWPKLIESYEDDVRKAAKTQEIDPTMAWLQEAALINRFLPGPAGYTPEANEIQAPQGVANIPPSAGSVSGKTPATTAVRENPAGVRKGPVPVGAGRGAAQGGVISPPLAPSAGPPGGGGGGAGGDPYGRQYQDPVRMGQAAQGREMAGQVANRAPIVAAGPQAGGLPEERAIALGLSVGATPPQAALDEAALARSENMTNVWDLEEGKWAGMMSPQEALALSRGEPGRYVSSRSVTQGTAGELFGAGTRAQAAQRFNMSVMAKRYIRDLKPMIRPENVGALGIFRAGVKGFISQARAAVGQGESWLDAPDSNVKDWMRDVQQQVLMDQREGRHEEDFNIDDLLDTDAGMVDMLSTLIAYTLAASLAGQEGRALSDRDFRMFQRAVGSQNLFADAETVARKIEYLEGRVDDTLAANLAMMQGQLPPAAQEMIRGRAPPAELKQAFEDLRNKRITKDEYRAIHKRVVGSGR